MDIKTGTKVDHERYGEGVITSSGITGFTVIFERSGKMDFSRLTEEFEILEEGDLEARLESIPDWLKYEITMPPQDN